MFERISETLNPVTDGVEHDVLFRTVTIIFNDRMTPPENRPAIGFPRFEMFYRAVCRSLCVEGNLSSSTPLPRAVAYISAEVPVYRVRINVHPAQNLFVHSVWAIHREQARNFDRALHVARHRSMRGRYAIDTLQFGYPDTLNDVHQGLWLRGAIAVKAFVSLDYGEGFNVYGVGAPG